MDRQAFKQRMQDLKSYRENNPGKGYWDWKVQSFADGGEVNEFQRKTRAELMREAAAGGRPSYEGMFQKQNEYQKDFAKYWYTERAKNPQYASQIGGEKLKQVLDNIEKATWKTPTEAMRDNLTNLGYTPAEEQIKQQVDILKENGTRGFANPKSHSYSTFGLKSTWHEGVGHMVGDNTPSILQATPNIHISNSDASFEEYVNQDNEKHAQTWDFRGNNSNLKDDQGNYYIDPNRQLTPEDISNMRNKGAKIPEQWESLEDADISELTNTFAYNMYQDPIYFMANGGEVGDPDDEFTKEYEDITSYVNMVEPEFVKDPDAFARINPSETGKKISLSEDNITKPEDFPTGLIRHEIGHYVDEMAYPGGVPNNAYLRQLGKPSKYRPFEEVKGIFRSPDKALQDYRYLRNPTEKKSIMNQFDEYLMNNYTPSTYPQTTKEFKEAIEKAPDIHRNMKLLLKIHNKPSILFKDFKNRPLVNNTTKDKNKELV